MYRTTEGKRARCPMCGADALTAPTRFDSGEGTARLVFAYTSGGEHSVPLDRARV